MELYRVNQRLHGDIVSSKYPQAHFINQENDINVPNTHNKKGWRHFIDGFRIIKENQNYTGYFTYDQGAHTRHKIKPLHFTSYTNNSGLNFLDFINSVINGDEKTFVHFKNFEVLDLRKKLFEIEKIEIRDTVVDDLLISLLSKYFSNKNEIIFSNCLIKSQCNFNNLKCDLEFNSSVIEDIRVFNDTYSKIRLFRSKVNKISNTNINSKELKIDRMTDMDVKNLFLKCNFPLLETLIVSPEVNSETRGFSYEDKFIYLPTSAPKLENLSIAGKLNSFDFLTDLKNMLRCEIDSIYDIHSSFYPDITDKKEKLKFKSRNLEAYNVEKILNPDLEEKFILGRIELNRIIKLAQFNKLLSYSSDEKEQLLNGVNPIEYVLKNEIKNGEITKFYELYFDTLYFRNTENDQEVRVGLEETYGMLDKFIYLYNNYHELYGNKKIVLAKNYIYNYDNKPIILKNRKKKINTTKDALQFREKYKYQRGITLDEMDSYDYNRFIEFLKTIKQDPTGIDIGEIIDSREVTDYEVKVDDFKKLGEGGKYIAGILEKFYRLRNVFSDISAKNRHYKNLLDELIIENYSKFSIEEKILLYFNNKKYDIDANKYFVEPDIYNLKSDIDESLLENINAKTNNLYLKYLNMIKLTYEQLRMQENPYFLEVDEEYIKKLKIN